MNQTRFSRHAVPLVFALSALGVLGLSVVAYYLLERTDRADALVIETTTAISRLERLHQSVVEAESAGRAFLISGDPPLHQTFNKKLAEIDTRLREFSDFARADARQQALKERLTQHINSRFAYLDGLVGVRVTRGFDALRLVVVGKGVNQMQIITTTLDEMKEIERARLRERMAARQDQNAVFELALAVLLLFGLLFMGAVFLRMNRMWLALQKAEAAAVHLAHHDALTGLPNRRLLDDRLSVDIARARRDKRSFAVLCLDLDGFKAVNDRYGHAAGDELLQQVAQRLTSSMRAEDTVARVGGDEFVATVSRMGGDADAGAVAAKIIRAVSEPYSLQAGTAEIATSIGIARYPDHGANAEQLLARGDEALYEAKKLGKKRYVVSAGRFQKHGVQSSD